MFRTSTIALFLGCGVLAACTDPSADAPTGPSLAPAGDGLPSVEVRYVLTRLSDELGAATAINSKGQVLAYAFINGDIRSFLWENGTRRFLGSLGGGSTYAHALNDAGQVAGVSSTADGKRRAFLWTNGTMRNLGTLGGAEASVALGIDGSGRVVGYTEKTGGPILAFIWENGTMRRLPGLDRGYSTAADIDNMGRVVGEYGSVESPRAYRWMAGRVTDLGTLGGATASAAALGPDGRIVGQAATATGALRGFIWHNGVMTGLGTLAGGTSGAQGISGLVHVVGLSQAPEATFPSVYLWKDGVKTNVGVGVGYGVNREGWVVGQSRLLGNYAALWRPTTEPPPPPGKITVGTSYFLSDRNSSINPAVDTVPVGSKVTWTWASGKAVQHSVQSVSTPTFPSSPLMGGVGVTYSVTFSKAGTYYYNCVAHPGKMKGRVIVK
jgi:probable HAF family extracellular repeat protein